MTEYFFYSGNDFHSRVCKNEGSYRNEITKSSGCRFDDPNQVIYKYRPFFDYYSVNEDEFKPWMMSVHVSYYDDCLGMVAVQLKDMIEAKKYLAKAEITAVKNMTEDMIAEAKAL